MFHYPDLLPPFSNREDFLLSVSVFDDDTGQAIDMTGIKLANPGASFTAAAWTVTDGAINTTSATSITIPSYPVGNQLSALALTVGTGLDILPGDPITIADTATGLNTMTGTVLSYTPSNGALSVQIGWTFQFEIRHGGPRNAWDDYSPQFLVGIAPVSQPILTASLGNGIMLIDVGYLQIQILEATFRQLIHRTYQAALVAFNGYSRRQLFVARLPVQYGGVTN
jgi:hypothetical protein